MNIVSEKMNINGRRYRFLHKKPGPSPMGYPPEPAGKGSGSTVSKGKTGKKVSASDAQMLDNVRTSRIDVLAEINKWKRNLISCFVQTERKYTAALSN